MGDSVVRVVWVVSGISVMLVRDVMVSIFLIIYVFWDWVLRGGCGGMRLGKGFLY